MKTDLKREDKELYRPPADHVVLVDVPELTFLMVDGKGSPTGSGFQDAIQALFGLSYTLKFALKRADGAPDYAVMPLEALWWSGDGGGGALALGDLRSWSWTALIRQAPVITPELLAEAMSEMTRKRRLPALGAVRLESFREGLAAQIMHIGPYSEEGPTIEKIRDFIAAEGLRPAGKHHEIYLGDPRRSAPERLRTVLRQPVSHS